MSSTTLHGDGSAAADAHPIVEVDRDAEPYRWRCPNGHCSWDRTNQHAWCPQCRRAQENGADVGGPEYWELYDAREDRLIPYAAVRFVRDE